MPACQSLQRGQPLELDHLAVTYPAVMIGVADNPSVRDFLSHPVRPGQGRPSRPLSQIGIAPGRNRTRTTALKGLCPCLLDYQDERRP